MNRTRFAAPVLGLAGAWSPALATEARITKPRMIGNIRLLMRRLSLRLREDIILFFSVDRDNPDGRSRRSHRGRGSEEKAEAGAERQAGRTVSPDGLVADVKHVVDPGEDLDVPPE